MQCLKSRHEMPFELGDLNEGQVLAIYTDEGPKGPCGQSMDTTCPHTQIHIFDHEDQFREKAAEIGRGGLRSRLDHFVVGEWGSGMMFLEDHRQQSSELTPSGCCDRGCEFDPPVQGTNGGCRCVKHIRPFQLRRAVTLKIRKLKEKLDDLQKQLCQRPE